MSTRTVVVYTMTGCSHCAGLKAYLNEKGIEFTERNVLEDDEAMTDFKKLGFRGTPVTVIGEETMVGFDRSKFDELLAGAESDSS